MEFEVEGGSGDGRRRCSILEKEKLVQEMGDLRHRQTLDAGLLAAVVGGLGVGMHGVSERRLFVEGFRHPTWHLLRGRRRGG
jgi:hypothetical protein